MGIEIFISKKGLMKFGIISSVIFSLVFLGFLTVNFIVPSFAAVNPGTGILNETGGSNAVWVNITQTTDMFFVNGGTVYIAANFTCSATSAEDISKEGCNSSMIADANFTEIGWLDNSGFRKGVYVTNATNGSWALFQFNATVNLTNIQQIQGKMIAVNASTSNGTTSPQGLMAPVIIVNMSTFGCPPSGQAGMTFPIVPGWNITANAAQTPTPAVACTQNTTLCAHTDQYGPGTWDDAASQWKVCAPVFGSLTTNLTAIAESGNMSAIQGFTVEAQGKGKIVFNTNISFASQTASQAVMEFAMKALMSGGKMGINDTEWAGTNGRPNLNLSANVTIYNISQYGIIGRGRPQIFRYPTHNSIVGGSVCPADVCSGFTWDGQNITFTVTGFSDYGLNDTINVTLAGPTLNGITTSPSLAFSTSYPASRINFTFTPVWATDVTMQNCTLYGNFTAAGTWAANATNQTPLVNGAVNGIVNNVTDGNYTWNVYCFINSNNYDYELTNSTLLVAIPPIVNNPVPAANITGSATQLFSVNVYDYNLNYTNVTLRYAPPSAAWTSTNLPCYNLTTANISFLCNGTVNLTSSPETGVVQYYFEATDNARNYNSNGTNSTPLTATIDRTAPTFASNGTNSTTGYVNANGVLLYANWTDTVDLNTAILETNESGANQNKTVYGSPYDINLSAGQTWSYFSWINTSVASGTVIQWRIIANDTAGNQNATSWVTFTFDNVAPTISGFSLTKTDTITLGSTLTSADFSCSASDASGVTTAITGLSTASPGIQTATCTATDSAGNSATATTTYTVYGIGGGGGAGGGAGGVSEEAKIKVNTTRGNANITIPSIAASKMANVTINKTEDMAITRIEITVINSVNNIKIIITKLDGKPISIVHEIVGKVYHYIEINKTNINDTNINKTKISFKVEKSWITANNVNESTIALNRYANNQWNKLNTIKVSEDANYSYFEAESPGFSVFAITGEEIVAVTPPTCSPCQQSSAWSDCVNNKQTKTNYKCDATTNYVCQSYTETKDCKKPTLGWIWILAIVIFIAAILWLVKLKSMKKKIILPSALSEFN